MIWVVSLIVCSRLIGHRDSTWWDKYFLRVCLVWTVWEPMVQITPMFFCVWPQSDFRPSRLKKKPSETASWLRLALSNFHFNFTFCFWTSVATLFVLFLVAGINSWMLWAWEISHMSAEHQEKGVKVGRENVESHTFKIPHVDLKCRCLLHKHTSHSSSSDPPDQTPQTRRPQRAAFT